MHCFLLNGTWNWAGRQPTRAAEQTLSTFVLYALSGIGVTLKHTIVFSPFGGILAMGQRIDTEQALSTFPIPCPVRATQLCIREM